MEKAIALIIAAPYTLTMGTMSGPGNDPRNQMSVKERMRKLNVSALQDIINTRGVGLQKAKNVLIKAQRFAVQTYDRKVTEPFRVQAPEGVNEAMRALLETQGAEVDRINRENAVADMTLCLTGGGVVGELTGISEETARQIAQLIAESK